jgi:plastocyanin
MFKNKLTIVIVSVVLLAIVAIIWWRLSLVQKQNVQSPAPANIPVVDTAVLPGGNKINAEQQVVTAEGTPVKANVMPNSPDAPKAVVVEKNKLSEEVIKIEVGNNNFNPSSFKVKAGVPVSLAFSSSDKKVHVITFDDPNLAALAFGVGAGQIKGMSFNAPLVPGSYEFRCDVPGHKATGEVGTMIVE